MCSDVNLIWTHGGQMEDGTVWPTLCLVSCAVKKRKLEKSWGCGTACYLPFRREVRKIVWHNTDTWLRWERLSHLDLQTEMHATTDEAGGGIRSSSRLPSLPPSDRQWESERRGSEWWEEVWCLSLQSAFLFSFSIPKDEQSKQESKVNFCYRRLVTAGVNNRRRRGKKNKKNNPPSSDPRSCVQPHPPPLMLYPWHDWRHVIVGQMADYTNLHYSSWWGWNLDHMNLVFHFLLLFSAWNDISHYPFPV